MSGYWYKANPNYKAPCPCGECKPRGMLGTSWWKRLGFNSPNSCTEALYHAGHRCLSDWACRRCVGAYRMGGEPYCDQCEEVEE